MALILRPPGSNEALEDRLADLGRTRKRFALAAGIFTFIAAIVGSLAFAGFLDAAFHLPPLVRGFALVSVLALGGLLWLCGVSRPSSLRTDPLAVALELEEHYPSLNDALASAITFLADDDAAERGVSNRLQRVAVRMAQRLVDRHEFERLIPSRSCWRAGWLCAIVLGGLTPLILVNPGRALTALVRLADPFGSHPWPTKTRVEILVPEELPRADSQRRTVRPQVRGSWSHQGPGDSCVPLAHGGRVHQAVSPGGRKRFEKLHNYLRSDRPRLPARFVLVPHHRQRLRHRLEERGGRAAAATGAPGWPAVAAVSLRAAGLHRHVTERCARWGGRCGNTQRDSHPPAQQPPTGGSPALR